jgi:uncharacterized protein (UPF0276 family)
VKTLSRSGVPWVGIANSGYAQALVRNEPALLDYVETAFEQLCHDARLAEICESVPMILHCSSLSVAGFVPPSPATVKAIKAWARRTGTPWIGEHLAYHKAAPSYDVGFTVAPEMTEGSVARVAASYERLSALFDIPLLLENSPIYFQAPGSTMNQPDFINAVCARSPVHLLLDLSHLYVAARNTRSDPFRWLEALPLDRVVELHLSSFGRQAGLYWDDHASPAPEVMFELLNCCLERCRPRAVTLEYNWSSVFPLKTVVKHVSRVRDALSSASSTA